MILKITFSESYQDFNLQFHSPSCALPTEFGEIQTLTKYVGGDPYEGEYSVTPRTEQQTIPTKDKVMLEDVTVQAIPFYNVSNNSGGSTVYIAKEV